MNNFIYKFSLSAARNWWCGVFALLFASHAMAQVANNYNVTPSSGTYTALTGGTAISNILTDDAISGGVALGFNFTFDNIAYTNVYVSSNGFLSFNSAAGSEYQNELNANTTSRPLIAPLWDDLSGLGGTAKYQTTGSAPNRIFTMDWNNWRWDYNAAANISFQVKLYETSNNIVFVYGYSGGALSSASASVGLAGSASSDFVSLSSLGTAPTVSSSSETSAISTAPANGQTYTFVPTNCFSPTNLVVSSITATTATLTWNTASATNGYEWKIVAAGAGSGAAAIATGTTNNATFTTAVTGLSSATNYDAYVRSDCGSSVYSSWSSVGNFLTLAVAQANETCATATAVSIYANTATGQSNASNVVAGAFDEGIAAPICNNTTTKYDVWYKFTTPASIPNSIVLTSAAGTETDWVMVLYSGSCAGLTQVQCSDDVNDLMPQIEACNLTPNTVYYVRLYPLAANTAATCTFWAYSGAACVAAPANDDCANAPTLTTTATAATTAGATVNLLTNSLCDQFGVHNDVWYKFSTGTGNTRTVNTNINITSVQSGKTVKFGVYKGSCGALQELSGASCGVVATSATATLYGLEENQTYYVRVWSNTLAKAGTFNIALSGVTPLSSLTIADAATATSCQDFTEVVINTLNNNRWVPLMDGSKIVAEINANGNNLGIVSGSYFRNTDVIRTLSGGYFLDRNIAITSETAPSSAVSIRFYYSNAELTAFQTASGGEPNGIAHYAGATCALVPSAGSTNLAMTRNVAAFAGANYAQFNTPSFSGFFVGPAIITLPVELQNFDVFAQNTGNKIVWTTASERNTEKFVVESSENGKTDWKIVATQKANGNSNSLINYSVLDGFPTSCIRYYRLKIIDVDGKTNFSNVRTARRNDCNTTLKVVPNPAHQSVDLQVEVATAQPVEILLTDLLGRKVLAQQQNLLEGKSVIHLDISDLPNANYIVQLRFANQIKIEKLVKQ
ncbi:MAG: hypothetical protein RL757_1297 [Bacteroidota bacterium]|jgi:hypothetical protein